MRIRTLVIATALLMPLGVVVPAATPAAASSPAALLQWNTIAVNTMLTAKVFQIEGLIHMAYVQAAVFDAVDAIDGGYRPYVGTVPASPGSDADAAVAAAAHRILVSQFPAQQTTLDATYQTAIAALPAGAGRDAGVAVGEASAAAVLTAREGDGLNANVPYVFGSGPGAWVLPTDNPSLVPQTPWAGQMKPFLIAAPDEFLPGPPANLHSARWARDFNETKAFGAATSAVRTPQETETALFWSANAIVMDNAAMRGAVTGHAMSRVDAARALALLDLVEADSGIACMNAKYRYSFWRPYTAIRAADTDGNPATAPDPSWLPLLTTPNHPEYPAAHGCVTAAQGEVFAAVLGSRHIDVDLFSSVTGTTHHFATVQDLDTEVVNARVWGGLHYRSSADAGVRLGRELADSALDEALAPAG